MVKIKIRDLIIGSVIIIVIAIVLWQSTHKTNENRIDENNVEINKAGIYSFEGDTMNYSNERGAVDYQISLKSTINNLNIYALNFTSRPFYNYSTRIFGYLFMPTNFSNNLPGLVFLPGGSVSKDQVIGFSSRIAKQGYAVLTIDQRGIGQTGGIYPDLQQDFQLFAKGYEPIQHLSVYDGLRTFDVLRSVKGVNSNNIAIAGESMGGRYALIAAAIDNRLKGAVIISSSGYHIEENKSNLPSNYLVSIDPDHYIGLIKPRYVFMLQGDNDSVVKLKDAQYTYSLASDPKSFFIAHGCGHGFCEEMRSELYSDLKTIFGND